jgi:hypothetical protein
MPRATVTWQQRGEYLSECFGMTPKAFAAGIDAAMARAAPQGTAGKSTAGARTAAGAKTSKARRAAAKQPAGATTGE